MRWLHAPTPTVLFGSSSLSLSRRTFPASNSSKLNGKNRLSMASSVRIVVVGDVHEDWDLEEDSKALELLRPDLALITGRFPCDFGNENVKLVRSIAALKIAKAAILGNHDAWNTITFSEKGERCCSTPAGKVVRDFHSLKLGVIGGRPFSNGGQTFFRKQLLTKRYEVSNMKESAKRICEAAIGTPKDHSIIILAHNGPTSFPFPQRFPFSTFHFSINHFHVSILGLGSNMNDICGRDWIREGGDHGDPGSTTKYSIPLVVFGHMHKELAFGNSPHKMIVIGEGDDNNNIH
ncbi:hypothetical protein LXL04_038091 [Taraxacum kok-saghyz]